MGTIVVGGISRLQAEVHIGFLRAKRIGKFRYGFLRAAAFLEPTAKFALLNEQTVMLPYAAKNARNLNKPARRTNRPMICEDTLFGHGAPSLTIRDLQTARDSRRKTNRAEQTWKQPNDMSFDHAKFLNNKQK